MSTADREKWDATWAERAAPGDPSPWIVRTVETLPHSGRALDLAGGAGRNALVLARHGLDVTVCDVSPVALALATRAAEAEGLRLHTLARDLDVEGLPVGSWDVVTVFHFLHRPLLAGLAGIVAPGGLLLYTHPTRRNLERHTRPPARFLLDEGELERSLPGFEIVHCDEGWLDEGRHEARVIARRSPAS